MKKNIKKIMTSILTIIMVCSMAIAICPLNIVAAETASTTKTNPYFAMVQGASVRYGTADGKNGIRFSAIVDKTQVDAWESEYKVTYGMLIAPVEYVKENDFNYENVFGENAKYYSQNQSSEANKKPIVDLQIAEGKLNDYSKDTSKKVINGSIYDIKDANLTREFVGRAYVKLEKDGNVEYVFAKYLEDSAVGARSVVYVADQALYANSVSDQDTKTWLEENYLKKAVTKKTDALTSGEVNADTIAALDKAYAEVSDLFADMSTYMYGLVSSDTISAVNARIKEISAFKNEAYIYDTEVKYTPINDYANQTTEIVEKPGEVISVAVYGGMYALSLKDGHQAGYAADTTFANGFRLDTQSADGSEEGFNVYMPLINYTQYEAVTMQFSTNNAQGIDLASDAGTRITFGADSSITYTYDNATGKLNVKLVSGGNALTGEITDSDVINGIKRASFTVWGIQYTSIYLGQVMQVTTVPKMTTTETWLNDYSGSDSQQTVPSIDGTSTVSAWVRGGMYALPTDGGEGKWVAASSTITDGLDLQTQSAEWISNEWAPAFNVYLPKINYTEYTSVSLEVSPGNAPFINLVNDSGSRIAFAAGTITYAYDKETGKLNATLVSGDNTITAEITDSEVINGTKNNYFTVWGIQYTTISVSRVKGTKATEAINTTNTILNDYSGSDSQQNVSSIDGSSTVSAWVRGDVYALPTAGGAGVWVAADSSVFTNGLGLNTQSSTWVANDNALGFNVYLPKINYTLYDKVSFEVEPHNAPFINLANDTGSRIVFAKGTITYAYDETTGKLNATLVSGGNTKALEITDSNIINGTKSNYFTVWGIQYTTMKMSQIIGTVETSETETVETPINDYSQTETVQVQKPAEKVKITLNGDMYAVSTTDGHQAGYTSDGAPEGYAYRFDTQSAVWCTNENAEGFNVYLPLVDFTKYDSVSMNFTGGNVPYINWTNDHGSRIALAEGSITYTYDAATGKLNVKLVSGGNTVTGEITDSEIINGRARASFTVWGVQYGSIYVSEFIGSTATKSTIIEGTLNEYISNPIATPVDGTLTAFVNGGVYAMPIKDGKVSGNGPWTALDYTHQKDDGTTYNAVIENGLEIQTQLQNNAQYRVYLPKLNYRAYKEVSMQIVGGPDANYANIGLSANRADSFFFSNGTLTLAYDKTTATLNVTLTDGNTIKTLAVTDSEIINGTKSFTFDVWGGAAYRGIYVSQIHTVLEEFVYKTVQEILTEYSKNTDDSLKEVDFDTNGYVYADNVAADQKFVWVNDGDIYALPIIGGKISGNGAWVVGSDTYIANSLEIQTQIKANHNNATDFVVFLPKIDFSQYKTVSFKLNSNNAVSVGFNIGDVMGFGNNETTVTYTYSVASDSVTATIANNSGTKTLEISDTDVIHGNKRATFVIVGQSYTAAYIGQLEGAKFDKTYGTPDYNTITSASDAGKIIENGEAFTRLAYIDKDSKAVADELRRLFSEITGVTLSYDGDNTVTTSSDVLAIILRNTDGDKDFKLPISSLTNDASYAIDKVGTDVVVYSKTKAGLMNGILGLLGQSGMFGLEVYTNDCYTYTSKNTVSLADITEQNIVTDLGYSLVGWDEPFNNSDYAYMMGQELDYNAMGAGWHNMLTLISKEEFGTTNPNWFSNNQLNLSYNDFEMVDTMVEKMQAIIAADTSKTYFSITPADNEYWSNSATSQALKNEYGVNSAEYIIFMNKVAEKINAWLAAEDADREIELVMFAYRQVLDAPVKANLTAEQQAMVTPYTGSNALVSVMICPSYMQWNKPLAEQTGNATVDIVDGNAQESAYSIVGIMDNWAALTPNLHFWFYSTHYDNYLVPFDSISAFAENFKLAKSYNPNAIVLYQGQRANGTASDWSRLKIYLQAELARDVNADVDTLIDNFMNAYFGNAATAMNSLFTTERAWLQNTEYISTAGKISGGNTLLEKYVWDTKSGTFDSYKSETLLAWMNKINEAYAALDESDPNYQTLHDRIELESLTIRYLLVKVYGDTTYDADLDAVYAACQRLGMTSMREGTNVWEQ